MPLMATNDAAGGYTGIDNLEVMAGARNYLRYLNDAIARVAGPPPRAGRLLDFGAGAGTHTMDMRRRGYDVACAELDPTLIARLQAEDFDARSGTDGFEPGSFGLVYTMNVLEHLQDDLEAVQSLRTVLRPGGRLVIYVPAFQVLFSSMDRKVGHVRRYRRRSLIDLVRTAGFTIDHCVYVDSMGFFTTLAYKAIGSRNGSIDNRTIAFYDTFIFPVSRVVDRLTGRWFGKNVMLVAHRSQGTT
jgi:SAM-dependent methyltransferase